MSSNASFKSLRYVRITITATVILVAPAAPKSSRTWARISLPPSMILFDIIPHRELTTRKMVDAAGFSERSPKEIRSNLCYSESTKPPPNSWGGCVSIPHYRCLRFYRSISLTSLDYTLRRWWASYRTMSGRSTQGTSVGSPQGRHVVAPCLTTWLRVQAVASPFMLDFCL